MRDGRLWVRALGLVALTAGFAPVASAAPGDLDATFSGDGRLTTAFDLRASGFDVGEAVAVQPDGKTVVAGSSLGGFGTNFAVARFEADGSLDPTFSDDGTAIFGHERDRAAGLALQPDGKIVLAGTGGANDSFVITRLAPDGTLDPGFGGDGRATITFKRGTGALAVALQQNGKIVAVGGSPRGFAVARLTRAGTPDSSFGGDGKVSTFGRSSERYALARAVSVQPNGRLVVGGNIGDSAALARYRRNGTLDRSFSGNGTVRTHFDRPVGVNDLEVQRDGKIVLVGGGGRQTVLARYRKRGALDRRFSRNGYVVSKRHAGSAVAIQGTGKIVTAGNVLLRYLPTGRLDRSFAESGRAEFFSTDQESRASDLAVQPDGTIAAAGVGDGTPGADFAVARYQRNGAPDGTFAGDGDARADVVQALSLAKARSATLQSDGRLIVAGENGGDIAVARYDSGGALDASFSDDGRAHLGDGYHGSGEVGGGAATAIETDGTIIVGGTHGFEDCAPTGCGSFLEVVLAGFEPDGTVDPMSWEYPGVAPAPGDESFDRVSALGLQTDGSLLIGGSFGDFHLARYLADGQLDVTFSDDGLAAAGEPAPAALAIQPDGRFVVTGSVAGDFMLARYESGGALDESFSDDGELVADLGDSDFASAVAVQPDGKLIAAGASDGRFALARFNADGTPDASFDGDGVVLTDFDGLDGAQAVAVQSDGKVVVAGYSNAGDDPDFAVARYEPDGGLDPDFSGDGTMTVDFGGAEVGYDMALQADGKIVVAGESDGQFAVARVEG